MVVFMIVGKSDPLFELEVVPANNSHSARLFLYFDTFELFYHLFIFESSAEDGGYLNQFILYSSIDMINSIMWSNSNM